VIAPANPPNSSVAAAATFFHLFVFKKGFQQLLPGAAAG
jgi:hypothetical protein